MIRCVRKANNARQINYELIPLQGGHEVRRISPMTKPSILSAVLGCALFVGGIATGIGIAQPRHPNLAAAKSLCHQAFQRISEAQTANEFDMRGHAAAAKGLLEKAEGELNQAVMAANRK
ncbi:MAG TPA: hypothetical protein VGL72_18070 [Bryobacteraceae bacterium]|jgi:hypothetical protein